MVGKCCVEGCYSNYKSPENLETYITVFKFPQDFQLKWKTILNLRDWKIHPNSVVCIKHFKKEDILPGNKKTLKNNTLPHLESNLKIKT